MSNKLQRYIEYGINRGKWYHKYMTYNEEPRPRVLFIGFDEDDDRQSAGVLDLFPTTRTIEIEELSELHQGEYDIAVTYDVSDLSRLEPHLYVVVLGGQHFSLQENKEKGYVGVLKMNSNASVAKELTLWPTIEEDERLKTLVEQTLLPIYSKEARHDVLHSAIRKYYPGGSHDQPAHLWSPTLIDRDGNVLAGFAKRSETRSPKPELWYLPGSVDDVELKRWLEYLIDRWSPINPAIFPYNVSWKQLPEWQSAEENKADGDIAALKSEHAKAVQVYEQSLAQLEESKLTATATADSSLRVLLTSQGETLKNAVQDTFASFGFTMIDVDKKIEHTAGDKADKLEDLQAKTTHQSPPIDWTSLIEVKGYNKGAKINDLLKLNRFTKRYMQESGGIAPDAIWYVVNHDLRADPSSREMALKANPTEVKEFGKDQGVVIDTVELFKLKNFVDTGAVTAENAREQLMKATGYFKAAKG